MVADHYFLQIITQPAPIRARAELQSGRRCRAHDGVALLAAAATGGTCLAIHGASCTPSTSVEWSRLIDRYPAPLISSARPGFPFLPPGAGGRVVASPRHLPPEAASETDAPSPFRPARASRLPSHLYYHTTKIIITHQPPPPTKPPLTPSIEK